MNHDVIVKRDGKYSPLVGTSRFIFTEVVVSKSVYLCRRVIERALYHLYHQGKQIILN